MIDVFVFGASGYSGLELLRLLMRHPEVRIVAASSDSMEGRAVQARVPGFHGAFAFESHQTVLDRVCEPAVALLATPARSSAVLAKTLLDRGVDVIDLSGAHRLSDPADYREWYGFDHPHPELLAQAEYGLSEWFSSQERSASKPQNARLIANPGCYASAAILAAAPMLKAGLVQAAPIVIDGKSGATGAGRTLDETLLFSEVAESIRPYRIARHQHTPEIEWALSQIGQRPVKVSMTAHLVPMRRGLLASVYLVAKAGLTEAALAHALTSAYQNQPYVHVRTDRPPETGAITHSNFVEVSATLDQRTGMICAFAAIDNLGKGAAGQAIQNLNGLYRFDPYMGLS